jgi:hypothetical protein
MGRFESDYDECSVGALLAWGRWQHNFPLAVNGKRGQAALRLLEAALLAMPEKRLISGWLATPDGECCVNGLYVAAKVAEDEGIPLREAVSKVAAQTDVPWDELERSGPGEYRDEWGRVEDGDGWEPTVDAAKRAGLTFTLAWHLGDMNDETCHGKTPEERYTYVLDWVRRHIAGASGADGKAYQA